MAVTFDVDTVANIFTRECISSAAATSIDFPWQARQVIVSNDASTGTLTISAKNSRLTLLAQESISIRLLISSVAVTPTGSVRVWAFG